MAQSNDRMQALWDGSRKYWEEVRAGIRPKPNMNRTKFTKKVRQERSRRAKAQWEALSPEKKAAEIARLRSVGVESWTKAQGKERRAKSAATRRKPENRLKMSKLKKIQANDPEIRAKWKASRQKWLVSPEGKAHNKRMSDFYKARGGIGKKEHISEVRWAKETGALEESKREYREQQEFYYTKALNALKGTGVEPERNQTLDYYKEIIAYFEPDWVDWV